MLIKFYDSHYGPPSTVEQNQSVKRPSEKCVTKQRTCWWKQVANETEGRFTPIPSQFGMQSGYLRLPRHDDWASCQITRSDSAFMSEGRVSGNVHWLALLQMSRARWPEELSRSLSAARFGSTDIVDIYRGTKIQSTGMQGVGDHSDFVP